MVDHDKLVEELKQGAEKAQKILMEMDDREFDLTAEQTKVIAVAIIKDRKSPADMLITAVISLASCEMEFARRNGKILKFEDVPFIVDAKEKSEKENAELDKLEILLGQPFNPAIYKNLQSVN